MRQIADFEYFHQGSQEFHQGSQEYGTQDEHMIGHVRLTPTSVPEEGEHFSQLATELDVPVKQATGGQYEEFPLEVMPRIAPRTVSPTKVR